MRTGKQHWRKIVGLVKKFTTSRSKELERELSSVRSDYRQLGQRASTLASEGESARETLALAKQQIEHAHGELEATYKAREQLAAALQEQLGSLKIGVNELQAGHHELAQGFAERGRQFEILAADVEAYQSAKEDLQHVIHGLEQRLNAAALDYSAVTEQSHTMATDLGEIHNELDRTRNSQADLLTEIRGIERRTSETEKNELAARTRNQALIAELAGVQREIETDKNSNSKQLADLELQLCDIEAERGNTRDRLRSLEHSVMEAASRHGDTQQRARMLEGMLKNERDRNQNNLNTIEEKLARVQIEQESLINIQSGLNDALRKNRRWATAAVGVAFLVGVLAAVTRIGDVQEDVPEQAAVTEDSSQAPELQVSQQNAPLAQEPLSPIGETTESAAFETETAPVDNNTEAAVAEAPTSKPVPTASETPGLEQAGKIDPPDLPPESDNSGPTKRPLTAGQAMESAQTFKAKAFFKENAKQEGVISLPSGLQYKVLRKGRGRTPGLEDLVILHYRGSLPDGREFDSSYAEKAPAAYRVDQVIAGWREALQHMQEGSQWELYIPPELAHRTETRDTPGFLPLIYQIELISVSQADAALP